jgi:hypothetical protein
VKLALRADTDPVGARHRSTSAVDRSCLCSVFYHGNGQGTIMKALFEARIEDLSIRDRVKIECVCGRVALIGVQGLGLPSYEPIRSLAHKLRCENCGERGKVFLSIVWTDA